MFLIENEVLGLRQYTHDDDYDMYLCWKDLDTQKGYNGVFNETFEDFCQVEINRFKFWVTAIEKSTNKSIGTLRLGLDEVCPDLAIWIYPEHRNKGYGKTSFRMALEYIFNHFDYTEISAGCFCDNTYSRKMLESIGFIRYPDGDENEVNCFTGEITTQLEFRLKKTDFISTNVMSCWKSWKSKV